MYDIVDINHWERLDHEPIGTKTKFWVKSPENDLYLFKIGRRATGENWAEKIASEIAFALGIPRAEIELAKFQDKRGTISKDFTNGGTYGQLIHGNELLYENDPTYGDSNPAENFRRTALHSLDRIIAVLSGTSIAIPEGFKAPPGVVDATDLFVGYLMLDALISNTDRHHENWGVIRRTDSERSNIIEIAPSFDHASSLGRELTDIDREAKMKNLKSESNMIRYLNKGRSQVYTADDDSKQKRPLDVFALAREKRKDAGEAWLDRLTSMPDELWSRLIDQTPEEIMSYEARRFALRMIELNRAALVSRKFQYE